MNAMRKGRKIRIQKMPLSSNRGGGKKLNTTQYYETAVFFFFLIKLLDVVDAADRKRNQRFHEPYQLRG